MLQYDLIDSLKQSLGSVSGCESVTLGNSLWISVSSSLKLEKKRPASWFGGLLSVIQYIGHPILPDLLFPSLNGSHYHYSSGKFAQPREVTPKTTCIQNERHGKVLHEEAHQKKPVAQAALHDGVSPGLSILISEKVLAEPLDTMRTQGSHLHPRPWCLHVFRVESARVMPRASLSVCYNLEKHSLWPSVTILSPLNQANVALGWLLLPVSPHSHPLLTHCFMGTNVSWLHL